jgi:hypothetical protein
MALDDKLIEFACPHCGQAGQVLWNGEGERRELVRLSEGFHVEEDRLPGASHVLVCNACDEIDPAKVAALA